MDDRTTEYLLGLAEWLARRLAGTAEYTQVFAERTLDVHVECRDGEVLATCVEPRDGVACMTRGEGVWRHRHATPGQLADPPGWLGADGKDAGPGPCPGWPPVAAFTPVPAYEWRLPDEPALRCLRSIEDYTVRAFAVIDSEGVRAADVSHTLRQRVEATVEVAGGRFRGLSRWLARGLDARPHPGAQVVARVAFEHARDAGHASMTGSHRTPVVFGPSAGAGFLHELVGHALEGDNFCLASDYIAALRRGTAIPRALTLVDDPTIAGGYGSYSIDDEGVSAHRTTLLADGELAAPLTSVRVARRASWARTGNGRRKDYRSLPIPRASNTVVLPGADDPDALLRAPASGVLFVGCLGAGTINLATGEYSFAALNCAYHTPGGRRVPVRDASLFGDALATLARLDGIGTDFGGDNITCGKQGQMLGIGVFSPSIRFSALDWTAA